MHGNETERKGEGEKTETGGQREERGVGLKLRTLPTRLFDIHQSD